VIQHFNSVSIRKESEGEENKVKINLGIRDMENLLKTSYKRLNSNQEKFDYLEKLFSSEKELTRSDYETLLEDDIEIIYFFIDEYHFRDLKGDKSKTNLITGYVMEKINFVDDYVFSDFLDFASKIEWFNILDYATPSGESVRLTLLLNFIESNFPKIEVQYLKNYLNGLLQINLGLLNEFIVLFNLNKLDETQSERLAKIKEMNDSKIQKRITTKESYYM
jgi:hypothetical protein